MNTPDELHGFYLQRDRLDSVHTARNDAIFLQRHAYDLIADRLMQDSGNVGAHLCINSKSGFLPYTILHRDPDARMIGLEQNSSLARVSQVILERLASTKTSVHSVVKNDAGQFFREYELQDQSLKSVLHQEDPQAVVIQDDIRSHKVLSQILGDAMLDSASINFSHPGTAHLWERPFYQDLELPLSKSEAAERLRLTRVAQDAASLAFVTQKMKTGGKLVYGRMRDQSFKATIVSDTFFGNSGYWEADGNGARMDVGDPNQLLEWVTLRRNDQKYVGPHGMN